MSLTENSNQVFSSWGATELKIWNLPPRPVYQKWYTNVGDVVQIQNFYETDADQLSRQTVTLTLGLNDQQLFMMHLHVIGNYHLVWFEGVTFILGDGGQGFKFYWPFQGGASFVDHFCYLCFVFVMFSCLFIVALWSPTGKGLTSWLSSTRRLLYFYHFLMWFPGSNVVLDCIDSWSLLSLLLCICHTIMIWKIIM